MARIQRALISVADKTGVVEFAGRLSALGIRLLSTGGTARLLEENGVSAETVEHYTGFPELLGGRLKTLHPAVHGALLARRAEESDMRELAEYGISPIDMVVVNLYPFVDVVQQPGVELMQALDSIDVGGVTLLRSAAKNYTHVAVVTDPRTYGAIADELEQSRGALSEGTHFRLAVQAFRHTAHYDAAIARYLGSFGAGSPGEEDQSCSS